MISHEDITILFNIIYPWLSINGIVLVVHVKFVKRNQMQKFDGMKIIIQLGAQNHRKTFDATSTTALHGLSFQMIQKW